MPAKVSLAFILGRSHDKEVIDLSGLDINDNELREVLDEIITLQPTLLALNLSKNQLGDDGAVIVAEFLAKCAQIEEIDLQSNQIGEVGMLAMFNLLNENPSLQIALGDNLIIDEGVSENLRKQALGDIRVRF